MGAIRFYQQDANSLGTPSSTQAYLGYHIDGSLFFKTQNLGLTASIVVTDRNIASYSTSAPVTVSLTDAAGLALDGVIIIGQQYIITGVSSYLYGGTSILVTGVSTTQFSSNGWGQFFNPKYNTYSMWDVDNTYSIGNNVIYGGQVWSSLTGNVSNTIDVFTLNTSDWATYSRTDTTYYNEVWDQIEYDIVSDVIVSRYEVVTNNFVSSPLAADWYFCQYSPIATFRWGDPYNGEIGIAGCNIVNSYFNCLNMINTYIYAVNMDNFSQIYDNPVIKNSNLYGIKLTNTATIQNMSMWSSSLQDISLDNSYLGSCYLTNSDIYSMVAVDSEIGGLLMVESEISSIDLNDGYFYTYQMSDSNIEDFKIKDAGVYNIIMANSEIYSSNISEGNFYSTIMTSSSIQSMQMHNSSIYSSQLLSSNIQSSDFSESSVGNINLDNSTIGWGSIFDSGFGNLNFNSSNWYNYEIKGFNIWPSAGVTSSNTFGLVYNNNTIKYQFQLGFNGSPGYGGLGPLNMDTLFVPNGFYIEKVLVDSTSLSYSGPSSSIHLGISGADIQSGINDANGLIDNINNKVVCFDISNGLVNGVKSGSMLQLGAEVATNPITGGNIQFEVILKNTNNSYLND